MKHFVAAAVLVAYCAAAVAALATLVRQYAGRSVTGLPITVCVYRYGSQEFERVQPAGNSCAPSVNIQ